MARALLYVLSLLIGWGPLLPHPPSNVGALASLPGMSVTPRGATTVEMRGILILLVVFFMVSRYSELG